jgi:hypothetical protein
MAVSQCHAVRCRRRSRSDAQGCPLLLLKFVKQAIVKDRCAGNRDNLMGREERSEVCSIAVVQIIHLPGNPGEPGGSVQHSRELFGTLPGQQYPFLYSSFDPTEEYPLYQRNTSNFCETLLASNQDDPRPRSVHYTASTPLAMYHSSLLGII